MVSFQQEEIVINAQTLTKGLQALKIEHESLLQGLETNKSEKTSMLEKSLERIDLGLGEAHVMVALASHLQVCLFYIPYLQLVPSFIDECTHASSVTIDFFSFLSSCLGR